MTRIIVLASLLSSIVLSAQELGEYQTPYYTIHTDLDPEQVKEAAIRMTKMAEVYHQRTSAFSGAINQRLPFYLYKRAKDFHDLGAPEGSAGFFSRTSFSLVALAEDFGPRTWNTVQHEGFHQFSHFVIRGPLPVWVEEGMAEYFGEGLFTGDKFETGAIPQWRLKRIRETFKQNKFRPLEEMMELTLPQWNAELALTNYDQGWSMVQFLAHGENDKHRQAFGSFLIDIGRGSRWPVAWQRAFGGIEGFEQQWKNYWTSIKDNPTLDIYVRANVSTLTSFYARALGQRQTFRTFADFQTLATDKKLKISPNDWLPSTLLEAALKQAEQFSKAGYVFALPQRPGQRPQLTCTLPDGTLFVGTFMLQNGKVSDVNVEIVKKPSVRATN